MRLEVTIDGDLKTMFKADAVAGARGAKRAMLRAADGLKQDLRSQTIGGGLGPRLAKTWRSEAYPKGQDSLSAAAFVSSNAPTVLRAFDEGVTIRSKQGKFLAIPTKAAQRVRGLGRDGLSRGKRIRPDNWPYQALGTLRFVPLARGRAVLVADQVRGHTGRKRGRYTKASRGAVRTGSAEAVVMFILVPQVRLRKRLDVQSAVDKWHAALPGLVVEEWGRA